jgi:hypothetical protein
MIKLASCNNHGAVYIADDCVYRVVDKEYKKSVEIVMKCIANSGLKGIVHTEICEDKVELDGLGDDEKSIVLKHEKIPLISYPHEWCASMFKDAALFDLEHSQNLLAQDLFLKDAHPWNILFHKGFPVFVDFMSILSKEFLFTEKYLETNRLFLKASDEVRIVVAAIDFDWESCWRARNENPWMMQKPSNCIRMVEFMRSARSQNRWTNSRGSIWV